MIINDNIIHYLFQFFVLFEIYYGYAVVNSYREQYVYFILYFFAWALAFFVAVKKSFIHQDFYL